MNRPTFPAKIFFSILIVALLTISGLVTGTPSETKKTEVTAASGIVASAHFLASQAGVEVLKAGGNAVDAAVAAAFAIGVVEPNASGIGGEGMMVIYLAKTGTMAAIDYRSTAPAMAVYPDGIPSTGPGAVAVPGTVAGLCLALEKYGTMPLSRVLAPAIKLAADGFVVGPTLASIMVDNYEEIMKSENLAAILCPEGLPVGAGETLRNPDLAESLGKIAEGGRDVFYRGELAETIAAEMMNRGGFITKDDLAGYRAIERSPVRGSYRGYDLISTPPPVGGLAVIEIMQIFENFEVGRLEPLSAGRIHIFAEAMRRGVADWQAYVADPDFVPVPVASLLAKSYAKSRAGEIDPAKISEKIAAGDPTKGESPSTTSLSVVDKEGNMVALTQTISDFFGAKFVVSRTGIIFNNEMKNFSARGINVLAPRKRMRTTISPTIVVKDGKAYAVLCTPGAGRILTTTSLLLSNLIDYKMGIQEAIEMPRYYPSDKLLYFEPRLPKETEAALTKMGYQMKPMEAFDLYFGGAQGIVIDPKTNMRIGGADPRRDGAAVGYSEAAEASRIKIPKIPPAVHDVRPGPAVKTGILSEYLPNLAGTPGDTAVYVLEGLVPGGTVFLAGGTHANEISGIMAAVLLVERAKVERGRLIVVPHANNSASVFQAPKKPSDRTKFSLRTESGKRTFLIGSRLTDPTHQGEPDMPGKEAPSPENASDNLARNLDRQFPGKADGNLTQRIAYAIVALLRKENTDLAFDLHEAPPESRLAMMIVANPKNIDLAAEAILNLETADLRMKLEESSTTFRGLSHREWGDVTPARAFLFETPNPGFRRGSPGDPIGDSKWPLSKRVWIHLAAMLAVIDAYNDGAPVERQVRISGLPSGTDLVKSGLRAFLR